MAKFSIIPFPTKDTAQPLVASTMPTTAQASVPFSKEEQAAGEKFEQKITTSYPYQLAKTTLEAAGAPWEVISMPVEKGLEKITKPGSMIPAIGGFIAPLLIPGGQEEAITRISKLTDAAKISKELRALDVAEEAIPKLSKDLSKMTDTGKIAEKISPFIEKTTPEFPKALPPSAKVQAEDIVYGALGQKYKTEELIANKVQQGSKFWEKQPIKTQTNFIDSVMSGNIEGLPAAMKTKAIEYRDRLDKVWGSISDYGDVAYRENYFPGFWKDPQAVKDWFGAGITSKRPLAGTASFKKAKVFEDISAGIKAGFEPLTTNPEKIVGLAEQNANKFVTANKLVEEAKAGGLMKFVKPGDKAPKNWAPIDDKIARVYFPSEKGLVYAGQYYAEPDLARMVNNYLSRSAIRESNFGRAALEVKNGLNAIQLGLSGFHLSFEAINSIISKVGQGIGEVFTGHPITGLKNIVTAPVAPLTTYLKGRSAISKFFAGDPEATKVIEQVFNSGMRISQNPIYTLRAQESLTESIKRGVGDIMSSKVWTGIKELAGVPKTVVENIMYGAMKPLFQEYIPKMKVGAWINLASSELERNATRIADGTTTAAEVLRSVARNIDNRFGELNYDTLFWNNTAKDILQVGFRALGWQIGNVRELGGAGIDIAKNITGIGGRPGLTPKIQYTIGLVTTLFTMDAVYQKLHTGKNPESIIDLIYPRNGLKDKYGNEQRVFPPTYAKDIKSALTDPVKMVYNKLSPEVSMVFDIMRNQDFWGDAIRNTNDPFYKQFQEVASYLGITAMPFSLQQEQKIKAEGGTAEQKVETFLGVVPAAPSMFAAPAVKAQTEFLQNMKFESNKIYDLPVTERPKAQAELAKKINAFLVTLPNEAERRKVRFKLMLQGVSIKGTGKTSGVIQFPTK